MSTFLVWLKQHFDRWFPSWPARWAAYVIAAFVAACLLGALVSSLTGCASTKEHVGAATITGVAAGVGGTFGAAYAAVAAFFVALWASIVGSPDGVQVDPWQLTLGARALTVAGVVVVVLVLLANRLEWFPDLLRRRTPSTSGARKA